jgi:DivIVA domain-containing protein
MAFMPEDVLNKNFTATQFRRGYDEQEVDDFLDEIVVELRRLTSDNDDLRVQLKACQERKGMAASTGAAVSASAVAGAARVEARPQGDKKDGAGELAAAQREYDAQRAAAAASTAAAEREAKDKIEAAKVSADQAEKDAAARIAKAKSDADLAEAQAAERVKTAREAKDVADKAAKTSFAASAPAATGDDGHKAAAGVLALAQKLHEEYVAEG